MNNYEYLYILFIIILIFLYFYIFLIQNYNSNIDDKKYYYKEDIRLIIICFLLFIPCISYFYLKNLNYEIPNYIKNIGIIIMILILFLVIKTSNDLGNQFSYTLEIKKDHKLIDTGIYKYIRHPMYLCGFLFAISQFLLIPNLIGNISILISMYIFLFGRIPDEEKMMINEFGDKYIDYMKKTNIIIPYIL